ncbi:outer membrane protein [Adhaeribacter aerolatus]|uniref:Outer membrane protein n=1 Tax=Adhaeribacter aerolatus TaxID=670289 RepID=A0A512B1N2_9BACT|nr:SGNH/GDSL hydrolase family protein [Adhaeribacter aerolatus]GEO05884.1 outer membrane protein [Adhaeribacter aerolatus]
MKNLRNSYLFILVLAFNLSSCKFFEKEDPKPVGEDLNFTKYLAVGNSLTAGYTDGGLYREGQLNAYPYILAQQFKTAGGGDFLQPLFSEQEANGSGYLKLTGFSPAGNPILTPVTTNLALRGGIPLPGGPKLTKYTDVNLQNLGVPGMSVLASGVALYGTLNPYFERLLEDTDVITKTYRNFISNRNHTFFSLWLGGNDVLEFATNGGETKPGNPFSGLTSIADFRENYNRLVEALTANGAKGVVATIPAITAIPFFTTISVASVRALAKAASPQYDVYIRTGSGSTDVRVAQPEDLILLNAVGTIGRMDMQIPHGYTPDNPLLDIEVLDKEEAAEIKARLAAFNNIITEAGKVNSLAVVDMEAAFNGTLVANSILSIYQQGVAQNPAPIRNSLFSVDGIHPTPRGYALIANEFLQAINRQYGTALPLVNPANYRGIAFP